MNIKSYLAPALVVTFLIGAFTAQLRAQSSGSDFLIIVNDSNPDAVTFTATSNFPTTADASFTFNNGFDLVGFFTQPSLDPVDGFSSTTLTTGFDGAPFYDSVTTDDFSGSSVDLNIYTKELDTVANDLVTPSGGPNSIEHFEISNSAFTGSAIFDFGIGSPLPPAGTIGDIYDGYDGEEDGDQGGDFTSFADELSNLVEIGQYEVIPEPSRWSMLLLGAGALFAARRFAVRKQA